MYTSRIQRIINWIFDLYDKVFDTYNCSKNRHRWGYELSKTGIVYMDEEKVPKDAWICLDCDIKRY